MFSSKKALSPIVATSLLIVVTVVALGTFQIWFNSFQSSTFTSIEQQGNSEVLGTSIDSIVGTSLFFQNGFDSIHISEVKINGVSCPSLSQEYIDPSIQINIDNCTLQVPEKELDITVITDKGVYSKKILKENTFTSRILDCSAIGPGEWIRVPGNSELGIRDFCVMKYEAKDVGGNPRSQAADTPWASINQIDAQAACSSLGSGYSLITDSQWVTVARNAENVASNWADGVIGSTVASGGGLKRGNVGIDDSASYDGANPEFGTGRNPLAMLTLSNGEEIWDLSGNVWEWTNDTFDTNADSSLDQSSSGWHEWTDITGHNYLESDDSSLNSSNGIGRVYVDANDANPSGTVHGFFRGGRWNYGASAGVFALGLYAAPSRSDVDYGFRCSYAP